MNAFPAPLWNVPACRVSADVVRTRPHPDHAQGGPAVSNTRLLNQTLALGDNPDDIAYVEGHGQAFIVLGGVSLALSLSSQAALDKLAVVAAQAAADSRARSLKAVA